MPQSYQQTISHVNAQFPSGTASDQQGSFNNYNEFHAPSVMNGWDQPNFSYQGVNMNNGMQQGGTESSVYCLCGLPCTVRISRQQHSLGDVFYACSKREDEGGCRFFEWKERKNQNYNQIGGGPVGPSKDPLFELQHRFGHKDFRMGQRLCVEAALASRDVFCLMPTGGGKSIVYQVSFLRISFSDYIKNLSAST
jgi:superfamily II DNA helicase RecQ